MDVHTYFGEPSVLDSGLRSSVPSSVTTLQLLTGVDKIFSPLTKSIQKKRRKVSKEETCMIVRDV